MNIVSFFGILTDAFFIALLVWCGYTDIRKRIVSNIAILILLCLGLAHTALMILSGNTWWIYPAGLPLAVPFLIAWLRNSMGAGDVKLVVVIGFYLGMLNILVAFVLMVLALAFLMIHSWVKARTIKGAIPFAPVLAIGAGGAVALGYVYALIRL
jgi:Flp pilus assembly protein protease CpaA